MNSAQNKAVRVADAVLRSLPITPGRTELELAATIKDLVKKFGGEGLSFRTIVASGKRSSLVHGFASNKKIRPGDVVMIDLGVRCGGYRSDITRTYFMARPTRMQKKIYSLILSAQRAAMDKIKGGVRCRDVDLAARKVIQKAGFGMFFKHTAGHGIGKKVHQAPKISRKNPRRLKAGQVITVEPGIYLKDWGIRIEDMVMVTKNGFKLLTRAPK